MFALMRGYYPDIGILFAHGAGHSFGMVDTYEMYGTDEPTRPGATLPQQMMQHFRLSVLL